MDATPHDLSPEALLADVRWLRRLAAKLVGNVELAEDLVQETWLVYLNKRPSSDRSLRPWLARVLANLARRRRRSPKPGGALEDQPQKKELDPAASLQAFELQRSLIEHVDALEDPQRSIVVLRYFREWDATRIGAELGLKPVTVRWHLKQALDGLRARLDSEWNGDRKAWGALLLGFARHDPSATSVPRAPVPASVRRVRLFAALGLGVAGALAAVTLATRKGERGQELLSVAERIESSSSLAQPAPVGTTRAQVSPPIASDPVAGPRDRMLSSNAEGSPLLHGRVVDGTGRGIPDAWVCVRRSDGEIDLPNKPHDGPTSAFEPLGAVRTDADGRFAFHQLESNFVRVFVDARGYRRGWTEGPGFVGARASGEAVHEWSFRLLDEGAQPRIRLTATNTEELVQLSFAGPRTSRGRATMHDGRFAFAPETLALDEVVAWTQSSWSRLRDLRPGPVKSLEWQPLLKLRIVREDNQETPWNASLLLSDGSPTLLAAAAEGASRELVLPVFPGEDLSVELRTPTRSLRKPLPSNPMQDVLHVDLGGEETFEVAVFHQGEPARDFEVRLHRAFGERGYYSWNQVFPSKLSPRELVSERTDANGVAKLLPPGSGTYAVLFGPPGAPPQRSARFEYDPSTPKRMDLQWEPPGRIDGVVLDANGDPVADAWVALGREASDDRLTRSDPAGSFHFEAVPPGSWRVWQLDREPLMGRNNRPQYHRTWKLGKPREHRNTELTAGGSTFVTLEPATGESTKVHGRVAIEGDDPQAWQAFLMLTPHNNPNGSLREENTMLDAEGRFEVEADVPARYLFGLRRIGGQFLMIARTEGVSPGTLEVDLHLRFGSIEGWTPGVPHNHRLGIRWNLGDGWGAAAWPEPNSEGDFRLPIAPCGSAAAGFASPDEQLKPVDQWQRDVQELEVLCDEVTYLVVQ